MPPIWKVGEQDPTGIPHSPADAIADHCFSHRARNSEADSARFFSICITGVTKGDEETTGNAGAALIDSAELG